MYALWHGSALGHQGYPAHLALWTRRGALLDELPLDSLDLPPSLLSTMVRELSPGDSLRITRDEVMTVAVGPRSELILPGRVGRLLEPARSRSPLYRLTLSPPTDPNAELPRSRWRREGWSVRNEFPLLLPGGTRVVHAE